MYIMLIITDLNNIYQTDKETSIMISILQMS